MQDFQELASKICMAAFKDEPPEHADFDDMRLYHAMKALYRDYKESRIKKEDAEIQKKLLSATYINAKKDREQWRQDIAYMNNRIKIAETCGVNLHKAQSLIEFAIDAAKMVEALTGDIGLIKKAQELAGGANPFE